MPRERRLRGINSSAVRHRISFEDEDIDIESVLERTKTRVFEIIREHAARYDANVKWYIVLNVLLYKLVVLDDKVDESVSSLINLHSYSNIALNVLENYEDFNDIMPRERRLRGINSSAVRHRISFEDEDIDIESVLERTKTRVFEIIREHAARHNLAETTEQGCTLVHQSARATGTWSWDRMPPTDMDI
ncbi:uncharacterized protein LOC120354531 [Nilaparvata lugens]|uniref:uncharacterized protein LOC120354531 n=1 Tax=Nilaparvata lugens TaxID=108931 RepID=UPI00193E738B|nr:uncharacterized protein LOC120354531 [Nilaparvata lugens]